MDDMGVGIDGKCRHRYRLHMATDKYIYINICHRLRILWTRWCKSCRTIQAGGEEGDPV